jgi:hypothetical protein
MINWEENKMANDKLDEQFLKKLIVLILELQETENGLIDLAKTLKDEDGRLNFKWNRKKKKPAPGEEEKEKISRLGGFLDAKKNDEDEEINPMDNEFYTIYRG